MKHDLFTLYDTLDDLPDDAPAPVSPALHTATDEAGVRTLTYRGDIIGHYHRARQTRLWRGVTHGGAIIYGRTEADVRATLLELYS